MLGISRWVRVGGAIRSIRLMSTQAEAEVAVDKAVLSKLRKKTGFPMIKCKTALSQFNNDIKQAEQWMREVAQKEGWEKAGKLENRPMSQGLLGVLQADTGLTVVEVNCETDFVARNENFQALVCQITTACHKNFDQQEQAKITLDKSALSLLPCGDRTVGDQVALTVGNLGENMAIRRASYLRSEPGSTLSCMVHAAGPAMERDGIKLGKFAALVKIQEPDMSSISENICQHIIGMNPSEVGQWSVPPADKKDSKKKKKDKSAENEPKEIKVEARLYDQEFLLEPGKNVREYLRESAPNVIDFVRIECGEDLGEED
ncbi:elongation factor Ts, mitochondrial-like [Mya arenaria]|uniref:elongation factor Ts, mitochondrial-like n=1 Tax=Mya arenaria TaxID=6604 RepID=UPI0022E0A3BE|nr:elongation factor Ts, mitochondrial-like [Mya arenaria]